MADDDQSDGGSDVSSLVQELEKRTVPPDPGSVQGKGGLSVSRASERRHSSIKKQQGCGAGSPGRARISDMSPAGQVLEVDFQRTSRVKSPRLKLDIAGSTLVGIIDSSCEGSVISEVLFEKHRVAVARGSVFAEAKIRTY